MERKNVRLFSILLVICMIVSLIPASAFAASTGVVYLKPNTQWLTANARFAAYFFSDSNYAWVSMTDADGDGYYAADVPAGYGSVIFCRMNPGTSQNNWDNKWNQTSDLTIPTDGRNCYTMTAGSWSSGSWGTLTVTQDYYLFGYINGANYASEEDSANLGTYKFVGGQLTTTFDCDSYVAVKTGDNQNWYMTNGFDATATTVTLYNTSSSIAAPEKMYVPGGVEVTFTLTVNSNGTLTLSYSTNTSSCDHPSHSTSGVCSACGKLVGHSWSNGKCSSCGAACEHSWSGSSCQICGITCSHSYDSGKVTKTATCTATGVKTYTCSKCGGTKTETIAATGHSYKSTVTDPSCTTSGYTTHTCTTCGSSYTDSTTAATGHSYDSGKVTKAATCTATGVKTYTCTKCSATKTETIAATGHSYKSTVTDPTCTESGYTTYKCSTCGHSYTSDQTSPCGHSYGTGKVTKAATCSATGTMTYTCANCGGTKTETIAKTQHSWVDGTCGVCGTACSHSYSGNSCTICGVTAQGITIHLVDTLGWGSAVAYAWENSTGTALDGFSWPGHVISRDSNGYLTLVLDYVPASGKTLGVLFHNWNGQQTVDITFSYSTLKNSRELWVKPDTTANSSGKYHCTTSTTESSLNISPEINGTEVTFRYTGSGASSVYLTGTMNNWSNTAMTKDSSGVWSVTLDLEPGVYEYKFVVNGNKILDPGNGLVGGYDGSSIAVVPSDSTTSNTGKITVVLHFYRASGDYDGWDVWCWGSEKSEAVSFTTLEGDKGMIATFTLDGTLNSNAGYVIRKTDWSEKEFSDRFIDLSDVVSGTVHYYVNSEVEEGCRVLGEDVICAGKVTNGVYDYETGDITVSVGLPLSSALTSDFSIVDGSGNATGVTVTGVATSDSGYILTLSRALTLTEAANYRIAWGDYRATISFETFNLFYSDKFASEYTYYGDDLGATWSAQSTTFKVWAPTAKSVSVKLYTSGNYGTNDMIKMVNMTMTEKGVWTATVSGDLNGVYYNYDVSFSTYTVEATDPYADSTGANGDRGMVLDMSTTDPEDWENDISPNQGMSYTDAIIYELHVREFTIDSSSGVDDAWKGKFLGLTQGGTSYDGRSTGLAHLKELGVTHVQLMPVYDYRSVDEYHLEDWQQYAWGYDPKNYNVPEGSYSTDPFDGSVRVAEFKEMVQTFHENGINVVMDVVYNHAFDGGNFCYNQIVPNYFCRFYGEGNWSNGSGCGNDIASERSMARNYIVDSILHWVEEYHVDGFRFDLVGLLDTQTINEIVNTVHAKYPYVMFYGEGWAAGGTAVESGYDLTTQGNAYKVPDFGFFNDSLRNAIAGDNGKSWGFASGSWDFADALSYYFRASNGWSTSPTQTINYVACHDNYSLMDKLILSKDGTSWDNLVKMNNLSAAIYMMAQGTPFIYSGEELLREKIDANGTRYDNAYGTNDAINKIYWSDLVNKAYAQVTDNYYSGLINFRKNHAALRCPNGGDAWNAVKYYKISDQTIMFYINGSYNNECSDGIVIIYNASTSTQNVNLGNYGLPGGYWQACVHGQYAGITPLWGVDVGNGYGTIGVDPISTTILVLGDLVDEYSIYNTLPRNCDHSDHNTSGLCVDCGALVEHTYAATYSTFRLRAAAQPGYCTVCGLAEDAPDTFTIYFDDAGTNWGYSYIYTWTCAGGRTMEYTEKWPGIPMTRLGGGIYSIEVSIDARNIIFNNGMTMQTADIPLPSYDSGLNFFSFETGEWSAYGDGCVHSYETEVTPPTCTTMGYTTHTCTLCGYSYHDEHTDALGHDYESVVTAPTDTADGFTTHTCTACGDSYEDSWVSANCFELAGVNMHLGNTLDMNFFINKTDLSGTDYYAEITHYAKDGTVTYTIPYEQWDNRSTKMVVTLTGMAARQMADDVDVVIYTGDGVQVSVLWTESIRSYVKRALSSSSTAAKTKTLLVDMLNYGAAAQTYFEYNVDDLANNQLTAAEQTYATPSVSGDNRNEKSSNCAGSSLVLKSRIVLTAYFKNITTDMYAIVSYTDHKGVVHENRVEGSAFVPNGSRYGVEVDDLVVADGDQLITVTVYDADGNQVGYCKDTVNSYAVRAYSTDPLFEAVMKFTTAAHNYFHA